MNNVMDETAQEIADLKEDLRDAQKETARLEKELQEAYSDKVTAPVQIVPVVDKTFIQDLQNEIKDAQGRIHYLEGKLREETAKWQMMQADLVTALALVEVIRTNKQNAWEYFMTPQGRERLKWATTRYNQEMVSFTDTLKREK